MSQQVKLFPDEMRTTIRALSWKEPFASLMLHGKIETRTWSTKYRSLVLICASENQVMDISGVTRADKIYNEILRFDPENNGHAIAVGHLTYCRPMQPEDEDKCFVEYRAGLFCHIYTNVRAIEPMPWKGSQGWGIVPKDFQDKIVYL